MKALRSIITTLVLAIAFTSCATRTAVAVRPAKTVVVTKVHNPRVVVHNNSRYYISKGVWYKKSNGRYITIKAPVGAAVTKLPRGYKVVKVRGVRYYKSGGVYYKRSGKRYIVVNV
ncbi:DUF6515 family protein [Sungkyunkwania multivorans]|uniref:DUF6515 family protein n=1 Tax=Sungkyunkwania multivorans TaxID=1173618 RepID=A0ABW3CX40_9FLAO